MSTSLGAIILPITPMHLISSSYKVLKKPGVEVSIINKAKFPPDQRTGSILLYDCYQVLPNIVVALAADTINSTKYLRKETLLFLFSRDGTTA